MLFKRFVCVDWCKQHYNNNCSNNITIFGGVLVCRLFSARVSAVMVAITSDRCGRRGRLRLALPRSKTAPIETFDRRFCSILRWTTSLFCTRFSFATSTSPWRTPESSSVEYQWRWSRCWPVALDVVVTRGDTVFPAETAWETVAVAYWY